MWHGEMNGLKFQLMLCREEAPEINIHKDKTNSVCFDQIGAKKGICIPLVATVVTTDVKCDTSFCMLSRHAYHVQICD